MPSAVPLLARIALILSVGVASASAEAPSHEPLERAVVANYAAIASSVYQDALSGAQALAVAVEEFLASPDETSLTRARNAWIAARVPYTQTEAFRFYDGPIDEVEGLINSWPIDENLIDYVDDDSRAGIVNHPLDVPIIDQAAIASLNEKGGEKNITTGFHAIEFLLWGQDLNDDGPGRRPARDYVEDATPYAARRREYLRTAAHLLVRNLSSVVVEWSPHHPGNFRSRFLALAPDEAFASILKGIGILSGAELAGERLTVPYETKEQEDEHSCFSDNTTQDIVGDTIGIESVVIGRYTRRDGTRVEGPAVRDLLAQIDPALGARLTAQVAASVAAARAVPAPFDRAILGTDAAPGRVAIKSLIAALRAQADSIAKAAAVLGLTLHF